MTNFTVALLNTEIDEAGLYRVIAANSAQAIRAAVVEAACDYGDHDDPQERIMAMLHVLSTMKPILVLRGHHVVDAIGTDGPAFDGKQMAEELHAQLIET